MLAMGFAMGCDSAQKKGVDFGCAFSSVTSVGAGSSDVISAAFNVEFYFDAFGPRVGNQGLGNEFAHA